MGNYCIHFQNSLVMPIIAVSSLQYIWGRSHRTYAIKLNCFWKPGIYFVDNYVMLKVCVHFENWLKYIYASLIGIKYK